MQSLAMQDELVDRKKKNILVYANTGLSSKQIGLTGELLVQLASRDHEISIIFCDNTLDNCYFNRTHNLFGCAACQARQSKIVELSGIKPKRTLKLQRHPKAYEIEIPFFTNLDELLNFKFEGIEVGRGAASSIISYTRDFNIGSNEYADLINLEVRKAINVYLNFKEILRSSLPDIIYIFNGRFAEIWPVIQLASKEQIPFYTLEAGAGNNYELFKNSLPHSISTRHKHILQYWKQSEPVTREELGHSWFTTRRHGSEKYEQSFTKEQQRLLLPQDFNRSKKNIVIFNSSEDELKAIMEWQTHLYQFQNEAIAKIIEHFTNQGEYHFYLRVHPNLGKVNNQQMREINQMVFKNATIIPPFDPIDTYALMEASDAVLTFGSSTGIEATYWQKPSILFGKSFYVNLDCTYNARSYDDLFSLLESRALEPKPRANTLPYGHYMAVYGKKSEHFTLAGKRQSKFKGHRIKVIYPRTISLLVRYLKSFKMWKSASRIYTGRNLSFKDIFTYK